MLSPIQQLYMDTCMQWNCGGNNAPFKLQVETVGFLVPDLCFWRSCYMFWSKRAACVTPLVISTNLSLRDLCHYYVSKEILLRTESPQEGSPPSVGLVRPRRAISMSGVDNTSSQGGNGFSLSHFQTRRQYTKLFPPGQRTSEKRLSSLHGSKKSKSCQHYWVQFCLSG